MSKSLRINRIAYGRHSIGRRTFFLLEPSPAAGKCGIPEQVVLHRWRKRSLEGYRFSGARLAPSIWWGLVDALGSDVAQWRSLSVADLRACLKDWRARRKEMRDWSIEHGEAFEFLSCPSAEIVYALISVLDERRLSAIVDRFKHHRSTHRSGVPDLFLFATDNTGRPCMARFIEVKKYDEDVSLVQKEVIAFLQSLGLTAAVLVLREPATAKRRSRTSRCSLSASPTTTGREDVTT